MVMKDFNEEDDSDVLWCITQIQGTLCQVKAGFKTESARDKAFDSYSEKEAREFVNGLIDMLTE